MVQTESYFVCLSPYDVISATETRIKFITERKNALRVWGQICVKKNIEKFL